MRIEDAAKLADRAALKRYAKRESDRRKHAGGAHGAHRAHGRMESLRTAEHKGHGIEIRTRYDVRIDGKAFTTHLILDNRGQLACHALPNYAFTSAIDLVKQILDSFPEEFSVSGGGGGHAHGHAARAKARTGMARGRGPKKAKAASRKAASRTRRRA